MVLRNVKQIEKLMETVDSCTGAVWIQDNEDNKFNLKSKIMQYVGIGKLIENFDGRFELFCSNSEDEQRFCEFFDNNPDTLE